MRARRPPRPRPRRRDPYYHSVAWQYRTRQVRLRAGGWCEFCRRRPMQACHHRTYRHFGQEPLADLMAVCRPCHRAIHYRGRRGVGAAGSLLAQHDSGMGLPPVWLAFLRGQASRALAPASSLLRTPVGQM